MQTRIAMIRALSRSVALALTMALPGCVEFRAGFCDRVPLDATPKVNFDLADDALEQLGIVSGNVIIESDHVIVSIESIQGKGIAVFSR